MSEIARRLAVGVMGQGLWRLAIALNAILLVPILISAWGVSGYGQWMTITALSSYLAYTNFGLVTTATNDLIMAVGAEDRDRTLRTFQMALNVALYLVPAAILVVLLVVWLVPSVTLLKLSDFTPSRVWFIVALAGLQLWFETIRGVVVAMLYATGRYGVGYNISAVAKFLELALVTAAVTVFHGSPELVAGIMAGVALADLLVVTLLTMQAVRWVRPDFRMIDMVWLRSQLKPSMGFTFYNFSTQGILLQGPRLVLASMLGGSAVAIYVVYGTAMRLIDQVFLVLMSPIGIEISEAAGRRNSTKLLRLIALGTQLSWAVFTAVGLFLLVFGPWIFDLWTHHKIGFEHLMMAFYLALSASNLLGRVSAHALISVNQMYGVSFLTFVISVGSVGLGAALVPWFGVYGILLGCILGEILNSMIVFRVLTRWLGRPLRDLLSDMFDVQGSLAEIRLRSASVMARYRS